MDDAQIIDGLRQGRPASADALIERLAGPLSRYFRVHLPDPSFANDMTQEVFLRLLSTIRHGTEPVKSLYSLAFTIARNLAIDSRRMAARRPRWESLDEGADEDGPPHTPVMVRLSDPGPNPRQQALDAERTRQLEAALRQLPEPLREVVVLRHVEGLGGAAIAQTLGITEGTVWSRLGRGLVQLRALLSTPPTAQPVKGVK